VVPAMSELMKLTADDLAERACDAFKRRAVCEWELALCLLAIEESRAFLPLGYSSVMDYAENNLGLDHWLAASMMTVVRRVAPLPAVSTALADGRLCWSKARTLVPVLTAANETRWLEYALSVAVRKLEKAVTLENRTLRRAMASGVVAPSKAALAKRRAEGPVIDAETEELLITWGIDPSDVPAKKPFDPHSIVPGPKPPEGPSQVSVTLRFSIDDYAIFEAAVQRICQREHKIMGDAVAVAKIMREFLSSGDARTRTTHPVVIQVDERNGFAYYDRRRGCLPAGDAAVRDALNRGLQKNVDPRGAAPAEFSMWPSQHWDCTTIASHVELLDVPVCDGGPYFEAPEGLAQQFLFPLNRANLDRNARKSGCTTSLSRIDRLLIFMRAGWRCERCGSRDELEIVYEVPRCHGGGNEPHLLRLLCKNCHVARHLREHADDPTFLMGRQASDQRRAMKVDGPALAFSPGPTR